MPTLYWCPHQVLKATGAPEGDLLMFSNKSHLPQLLTNFDWIDHIKQIIKQKGWLLRFFFRFMKIIMPLVCIRKTAYR